MREEKARRKAEFRPGIEIRLADGQFWSLPVPTNHADRTGTISLWDDPTCRSIIEAAMNADDPGELFRAELALAIHLLDSNYILNADDFEELLDDRGDPRLREEIRCALRELLLAHAGAAHPANEDDSQTARSSPRADGRSPISLYVSRIFGRLGLRQV